MPLMHIEERVYVEISWRIFRVETKNLTGRLRHLSHSIPAFPLNRNGSEYLNWDDGMPLNEFIALVCSSAGSESTALHDLEVRAMRDAIFLLNFHQLVLKSCSHHRRFLKHLWMFLLSYGAGARD